MQLTRIATILTCCFLIFNCVVSAPAPEEPFFELPVQLVGFPIIIAAVRISNFVKKLSYSLNPQTYSNRTKRTLSKLNDDEILDVSQVEKRMISELGENVCIYERICTRYAEATLQKKGREHTHQWDSIFSQYKSSPDPMKEYYLLSVFMGDIIGSPRLCHQLAKRGRECKIPLSD